MFASCLLVHSLSDKFVKVSVMVGSSKIGCSSVVVMTEVSGASGAHRANEIIPLLGSKVSGRRKYLMRKQRCCGPVQFSGHQRACFSSVTIIESVSAPVEMFPGPHHVASHRIQVAKVMLVA